MNLFDVLMEMKIYIYIYIYIYEVEKFCGWVLQCKTKEEIMKIKFYKFIWVF